MSRQDLLEMAVTDTHTYLLLEHLEVDNQRALLVTVDDFVTKFSTIFSRYDLSLAVLLHVYPTSRLRNSSHPRGGLPLGLLRSLECHFNVLELHLLSFVRITWRILFVRHSFTTHFSNDLRSPFYLHFSLYRGVIFTALISPLILCYLQSFFLWSRWTPNFYCHILLLLRL